MLHPCWLLQLLGACCTAHGLLAQNPVRMIPTSMRNVARSTSLMTILGPDETDTSAQNPLPAVNATDATNPARSQRIVRDGTAVSLHEARAAVAAAEKLAAEADAAAQEAAMRLAFLEAAEVNAEQKAKPSEEEARARKDVERASKSKSAMPRQWRRDPSGWKKTPSWSRKKNAGEKISETTAKVAKAVETQTKQLVQVSKQKRLALEEAKVKFQVKELLVLGMLFVWSWPWLVEFCMSRVLKVSPANPLMAQFRIQLATLRLVASRLLLAALCGAVIGFERRDQDRPAGLRSMTLVSSGSALYVFACLFSKEAGLHNSARAAAQVCSGVGFIGAGVIAKGREGNIKGLTTACAVWVSSALGVTAASGLPLFTLYATGISVSILRISRWYNALTNVRIRKALLASKVAFGIAFEELSKTSIGLPFPVAESLSHAFSGKPKSEPNRSSRRASFSD